jgi:hypothetical protein
MDEQLGKARHPKETCEEEIIDTSSMRRRTPGWQVSAQPSYPTAELILEPSKIPA